MRSVVAIDVGRFATKWVAGDGTAGSFPSVVGEARKLRVHSGGEYQVEVTGMGSYFIGVLAEESQFPRRNTFASKIHAETKVLFLTALVLAGATSDALIFMGLPVEQHNDETKAAMHGLLCGTHEVAVNGDTRFIKVTPEQLRFVVEGGGAYLHEALKDDLTPKDNGPHKVACLRVIDLGSRNLNYLTVRKGRYRDVESGTLNYGCLALENHANVNDANDLAYRIVTDLSQRLPLLDTDSDVFLLAGGGAPYMLKAFQPLCKQVEVVSHPELGNVLGFRKMGMEYARKVDL